MTYKKTIQIIGVVILVVVFSIVAREYWRHLNNTKSYEECSPQFKTTEVSPGVYRCKVPFLGREFFFDTSKV